MSDKPTSAETDVYTGREPENTTGNDGKVELTEKETYTAAEMKSEVDRRLQQATNSVFNKGFNKGQAEAKVEFQKELDKKNKQMEESFLIENHKYKELSTTYKKELDALRAEAMADKKRAEVTRLLGEKGFTEYSDFFINNALSIEETAQQIEKFIEMQESKIVEKVKEKMTVGPPIKSSEEPTSLTVAGMSTEQYLEYKKSRGLR
ncbi:MAG: hypothetical protein ACTSXD_08695 [Candidatus Heimdallarchaeaceae archaeon]